MNKTTYVALGIAAGCALGCAVACLVVHRRVISALVTGAPMPEPPAWHKGHPFLKKAC